MNDELKKAQAWAILSAKEGMTIKTDVARAIAESTPKFSAPSSLDQPADDVGEIKASTLMEIGFAFVGKQCFEGYKPYGDKSTRPTAVCALGAIRFAASGDAQGYLPGQDANSWCDYRDKLGRVLGKPIYTLNNIDRLTVPEIAAKLRAVGL